MSELTGTPKQITWATQIRNRRQTELESWLEGQEQTLRGWRDGEHYDPSHPVDVEAIIVKIHGEVTELLTVNTRSQYWIETRDMKHYQLLNKYCAINNCEIINH